MKRLGFLDGRRTRVGGVPIWGAVPNVLIPGTMEAFGIFEECLHLSELDEPSNIGHMPPGWEADIGGSPTLTTADLIGGVWLLKTDGDDNDWIQLTLGSIDGGAFIPQAGKDIWFEAYLKLDKANEIIAAIGLQDPSTSVYMGNDALGPAVSNHLLFNVVDGGAGVAENWYFEGDKAGDADSNDLEVVMGRLTWVRLGFHVRGITQVDVYVNRALVAEGKVTTDYIPITGLMPCVCLKAGKAEIQSLYVDYIMCVQKR